MKTPPTACSDCHDLIGGYVLGALDAEETVTVRLHLRDCPECAAEHARLAGIPSLLDLAGATETAYEHPPAQLEEAVLDRFAREHPARHGERPRPRRRLAALGAMLRRPLPAAAAAALVAAAVTAAIVLPGGGGSGPSYGLRDVYKATLTGSPAAPSAHAYARLRTVSSGTRVWLRVNGLRSTPDDLYELWCVRDDGTKISAGTFRVDAHGQADVNLTTAAVMGEYHRLSVERKAQPPATRTGQRVMAGEIEYGTS